MYGQQASSQVPIQNTEYHISESSINLGTDRWSLPASSQRFHKKKKPFFVPISILGWTATGVRINPALTGMSGRS
jgi:hypothetical protein